MKTQSQYSPAELYKLQSIKQEIQDLRKQLIEIDQEVGQIKQNFPDLESEQAKTYSQAELVEVKVEKTWGNYVLVVLIACYFIVMSFL